MLVYSVRRILATIPILLVASFFVFWLASLSGNPLEPLLLRNPPPPESTIVNETNRLYMDQPFLQRYGTWLTGIGGNDCSASPGEWFASTCDVGLLRGNFGPSVDAAKDLGAEVGDRFVTTVRLVGAAMILAVVFAVIAGVVSAVRQYSKLDYSLTFVGFLALSMPVFWIGALIKEAGVWINDSTGIPIFYTIGATSPDTRSFTFMENLSDILGHLVLPTLTLMLVSFATLSRFQRASMLEVLNSDYVRLARAKGLRNRVVMRRHALRTALIPLTTVSLLVIAGTIDGAVLTETVFQWRGLGTFFADAVRRDDLYAVMAFVMITGVIVVVFNLIADLLYAVLDPRIRYD
jgi:peptide/nickel transport system permease protein